eukprot:755200-Hanusia_phi.AAC.3
MANMWSEQRGASQMSSDIVTACEEQSQASLRADEQGDLVEEPMRNTLDMYIQQIQADFTQYVTRRAGDFLQQHLMECRTTVYRKDMKRIISAARPLHALITLRAIQILLVVVGILLMLTLTKHGQSFLPFSDIANHEIRRSMHFRFNVLALRGKSDIMDNSSSKMVHDFGVLQDNCKVRMAHAEYEYSQQRVILKFGEEIEFDGWYFVTNNFSAEADPIDFRLETSKDGEIWQEVGLPWVCGSKHKGDVVRNEKFSYPTPLKRLEDVKFDFLSASCTYGQYLVLVGMLLEGSMIIVAAILASQDFYVIPVMVSLLTSTLSA